MLLGLSMAINMARQSHFRHLLAHDEILINCAIVGSKVVGAFVNSMLMGGKLARRSRFQGYGKLLIKWASSYTYMMWVGTALLAGSIGLSFKYLLCLYNSKIFAQVLMYILVMKKVSAYQ